MQTYFWSVYCNDCRQANVTVGGCSTDSSVRVIKQIEETFSINMFDRQSPAFIVKDKVQILPLAQFKLCFRK
jgi:hypothetical protein